MDQPENFTFSQSEIKKLQQTINKQIQSSPLKFKMQSSEIYSEMNEKPQKSNAIMQTSAISPSQSLSSNKNFSRSGKKEENKQKSNKEKPQQKTQKLTYQPPVPVNSQEKKAQQRQFLITQNKTLKEQTLSLVDQLQILLGQTKQKKYGINITDSDEPKQVTIKKAVLAQQLAKITRIQSAIAYEKRQLKYVYDDENVIVQQAEVKILENELQKLEKDKKAVMNILKEQNKGIQLIQMSPEFKEKFNRTKEQLQKLKEECKILQNKTLENQRLLKKKHQKAVGHHAKVKKIEKMLRQKQEKKKKGNDKYVTLEMMAEVEDQIAQLEEQKMISQKSWVTKIANIEAELQTRKLEQEKKILILKDKEKQVRLNDLRIKELKKLAMSKVASKRKVSLSGDQAKKQTTNPSIFPQGRKRNIIFMDINTNKITDQDINLGEKQEEDLKAQNLEDKLES